MVVQVVRGTNDKPIASDALVEALTREDELMGQLMIGFPILGTQSDSRPMDAVFLSAASGVVVFDLVEGSNLGQFEERQDDAARLITSKLLQHRELVRRSTLQVPVSSVTFAPGMARLPTASDEDYYLSNTENLGQVLEAIHSSRTAPAELYERTLSALQNIATLRAGQTPRTIRKPGSRGDKLDNLEKSIATLDNMQSKAVVETIIGVQRIRGLAGSGKTIILALKAAYLHAQHPDWRIAVTFNTRSLKEQFRNQITGFVIDQASREPDWEKLRIINAWGGRGRADGLYSEFCRTNQVAFVDYQTANNRWGRLRAFDGACTSALEEVPEPAPIYDAILIDEAQDFPASFLRLCYSVLGPDKRLVYAYDELQSLHGEGLASPEEIFGDDDKGQAIVTLAPRRGDGGARRDIVLDKCYRNSRPVLTSAHSLGFGIYHPRTKNNPVGLIQMFDRPSLWTDIGYRVEHGALEDGKEVALLRSENSSPVFLESHSTTDELIRFRSFDSAKQQNEWIASEIENDLKNEELRHQDILVINPQPISARENLAPIRQILMDKGIGNHLAGVDTSQDVFFDIGSNSITFTGIYRAKGNEAGMVYVVNANECDFDGPNLAAARNALFTAITRSKAWVRVTGVGPAMDRIMEEYNATAAREFALQFTYPTEAERRKIRILHRELTKDERSNVSDANSGAKLIAELMKQGKLHPEDFDSATLEELVQQLSKRGTDAK